MIKGGPGGIVQPTRVLDKKDNSRNFCSGIDELDLWLRRFAWKNQKAKNSVTYVSTVNDEVVGYYCLSAGSVLKDELPTGLPGGNRPIMTPVIILGRFAVDKRAQGKGLGTALLRDAIVRAESASTTIGAMGLVIHRYNETAKQFYLNKSEFLEFPGQPLHLLLPL
ncbi:Acetyltransferase (GNAT) family protein [Corynebacterium aquatimens]|nr:Acetyltransferase (GNAT) family protein [Corynebacterium aquatimens]